MTILNQPATAYSNRQLLLTLYAVSLMVHFGFAPDFLPVHFSILVIAGLLLVFQPNNIKWPLIAAVTAFIQFIGKYPELANHASLEMFTAAGILFLFLRKKTGKKASFLTPQQLSQLFRYTTVTVYFLTGFHKLNWGFFDRDTSCANEINGYLLHYFISPEAGLPLAATRFFQASALFVELVVPFGLLFVRTRLTAAALLLLFHVWLCWMGFANFSSFALFLITGCLLDFSNRSAAVLLKKHLKVYVLIAILSAVAAFIICNWGGKRFTGQALSPWMLLFSALYSFVFVFFAIQLLRNCRQVKTNVKLHYKVVLPVLFVFLWGTQCYYGLANRGNLTMYSNLITEAGRSNHLLINTAHTKLFHFEEDHLLIQKVSDNLLTYTGNSYQQFTYPLVLFRKRAARWSEVVNGPVYIRLLYKNRVVEVTNLQKSPFTQANWYDRFLFFRETPLKGNGGCYW